MSIDQRLNAIYNIRYVHMSSHYLWRHGFIEIISQTQLFPGHSFEIKVQAYVIKTWHNTHRKNKFSRQTVSSRLVSWSLQICFVAQSSIEIVTFCFPNAVSACCCFLSVCWGSDLQVIITQLFCRRVYRGCCFNVWKFNLQIFK